MKRFISFILATLLLSTLLADRARAADVYELPVVLSATGPLAFLGKDQTAALSVAEALVNKEGGIDGRPIKFVIYDDQTNPQVAVQLMNQVLSKRPIVIFGSSSTAACNAMAPFTKDGPVMYCFTPSFRPSSGTYTFSTSVSSGDLIGASLRYFRQKGWKKMALLAATDAAGQDGEQAVSDWLAKPENRNMSLVAHERFNTGDISVAAQLARIKSSGADAMIAWTTGTPLGTVLRAKHDTALAIPIVTSPGNLSQTQLESYKDFIGDNVFFPGNPGVAPDSLHKGRVKTAASTFSSALSASGIRAGQGNTLAWDPVFIVVDALRKLGPAATGAQLREYLANLHNWDGINGTYDFRAIPQRGIGIDSVIIVRWSPADAAWSAVSKPGGMPFK